MKVNKVFLYSQEVAKKNRNTINYLLVKVLLGAFLFALMADYLTSDDGLEKILNIWLFAFLIIFLVCFIMYYAIVMGLKLRVKVIAWVETVDNMIFKAEIDWYNSLVTSLPVTSNSSAQELAQKVPNILNDATTQILKVYAVTENKHYIIVKCDYKILLTNKVKYNKKIYIEKSYNELNDLVQVIKNHIG